MKKISLTILLLAILLNSGLILAKNIHEFRVGNQKVNSKINTHNYQSKSFEEIGSQLQAISFIDDNTGFVAGAYGIWKTTNAGQNWKASLMRDTVLNDTSHWYFIFDIKCFNEVIYAIGYNESGHSGPATVFISRNCGTTWDSLDIHLDFQHVQKLYCYNKDTVLICGIFGKILKTTDGFNSWTVYDFFEQYNYPVIMNIGVHKGRFYTGVQNSGYCLSSADMFLWKNTNPINNLYPILASTNSNLLAVGQNSSGKPIINLSSNEGASWADSSFTYYGAFLEALFVDENVGYIAGCSGPQIGYLSDFTGYIYQTTNGGHNWTEIYQKDSTILYDICRTPSYTYFSGAGGVVIRLDNSISGILNGENNSAMDFRLNQNYPNPFNPTTKISYSLPKNSSVNITVYDISGREVQTLVNQKQTAGSYEISFDGSKLSSGAYFYRLRTDDYVATKKMLLVK